MFEFEEKGKIESDFTDGKTFSDDRDYSWSIRTVPAPEDPILKQKLGLNIITLEVSRLKDIAERKSYVTKYFLTTYLDDKKS